MGYEGNYAVSNYGRVASYRTNNAWGYGVTPYPKLLKQDKGPYGHARVTLSQRRVTKRFLVSQLVLKAFGPSQPPGRAFALHGDDDPANNHISNLRWGNYSDNEIDKRKKMSKQGVNGPGAKLTMEDVHFIYQKYKSGAFMQKELAVMFGVNKVTIHRVLREDGWTMKQYHLKYG